MIGFLKILRLAGLAAAALLAVTLYRNSALTEIAKSVEDPSARALVLARADSPYPLNDRTHYELGKTYFDLGLKNFGRGDEGARDFRNAVGSFKRSLELNPFSPFAHFGLARGLFYMDTSSSAGDSGSFREYHLAAETSGTNSQIYFEVGRILMSRWNEIGPFEREFATGLLKTVLSAADPERLRVLFNTWEMNVLDYGVMDKLLPDKALVHRAYARFLGERSLSLDVRQRVLAKADALELAWAKEESKAGVEALYNYRAPAALQHFTACLGRLGTILFYQDLTGQNLVDPDEYANLRKSALLSLIKTRVELRASMKDIVGDLSEFLELETGPAAIGELELLLQERGLITKDPEMHAEDLDILELQLRMYFVQSRYQEIIRIGRLMVPTSAVPSDKKDVHVRILGLLGDAHMKVDNLYDAGDFYRRALDLAPENLEILIKLRQNLRLLNNEREIDEIQGRIRAAVFKGSALSGVSDIPKGSDFLHPLVLERGRIGFTLVFEEAPKDPLALVTVVLNDRVIWEGYLRARSLTLSADSRQGRNKLNIIAINYPVRLASLELKPADPGIL